MAIKFLNDQLFPTDIFLVDVSAGRVGIGVAAPESELHVNGNVLLSNNKELRWLNSAGAQESILELNGSDLLSLTGPDRIRIVPDGNAAIDLFSGHNTKYTMSSVHSWEDNNSNVALRITANGNVGITDATPNRQLTLGSAAPILSLHSTSTTGESSIYFGDPDDDNEGRIVYSNSQDAMQIFTAAAERIRIKNDGNVGINTLTPSQILHVAGNARVTGAYYDSNNSPGTAGQVLSSTATGTGWVAAGTGTITGVARENRISFGSATQNDITNDQDFTIVQTADEERIKIANGGVQVADMSALPVASLAGSLRYRVFGQASFVDMCMQTSPGGYSWVNIVQNSWTI